MPCASSTGGARIGVENLTCEMAAAVTLWVEYEVQPLAQEMFGQRVTSLGDFGTYDCRNIIGNPIWKGMRSQHAAANALDISGFTFADGRQISVLRDWSKKGPEGQFLHEAHRRACRYFRVALSPRLQRRPQEPLSFRPRPDVVLQVNLPRPMERSVMGRGVGVRGSR